MKALAIAAAVVVLAACGKSTPPAPAADTGPACVVPPPSRLIPHRSLVITDVATLGARDLSLPRVLEALRTSVRDAASYRLIGAVDRFELTPSNGRHCGLYALVYQSGPRALVVESILPNPQPACGTIACRPARTWLAQLSTTTAAPARAALLETFLFTGVPGFRPALHPQHVRGPRAGGYPDSSGTLRTYTATAAQAWLIGASGTLTATAVPPLRFTGTSTAIVPGPDGPAHVLPPVLAAIFTYPQRQSIADNFLDATACEPCAEGPEARPEDVVRRVLPRDPLAPLEGLILRELPTDLPLQGAPRTQ